MLKGSKHSPASRAKMSTRSGQVPWNKGLKTGIAPSNKGCFGPYSVSGVYQIECAGELYIGSSKNIRIRWNGHKTELRKGLHDNAKLQALFQKHGVWAFKLKILEVVPEEGLVAAEQKWMDELRPTLNAVLKAGNVGRPPGVWTAAQREAARSKKLGSKHSAVAKSKIAAAARRMWGKRA